jgi:hypothetical protein
MRSLPKALRLLTSRSFASVSFLQLEPSLHTSMNHLFVFLVNNCLYHDGRLFMAFRHKSKRIGKKFIGFYTYSLQTLFHFMGFTTTSIGSKESFLPHLGHFPL